jgi:pilus assembly protein CpaB
MKLARILVFAVAIGAAGAAALLAGRWLKPPEFEQVAAPKVETVDILIAKSDIGVGQTVTPETLQWQAWPKTASTKNFIRRSDNPQAIKELSGEMARLPIVAGEPIREAKLINAKGSGFMAAILPSGMRAVSTQISPEIGAGGFILPNDHVDVIFTRGDVKSSPKDAQQRSETILSNVRILAIDQNVQEKDGQKVVVGKTATLELTRKQAEKLALAQQLGTLSLALRSITDARHDDAPQRDAKVTIFHGLRSQDYSVSVEPESACASVDNVCPPPLGGDLPGAVPENEKVPAPIERHQQSQGIVQKPFFLHPHAIGGAK